MNNLSLSTHRARSALRPSLLLALLFSQPVHAEAIGPQVSLDRNRTTATMDLAGVTVRLDMAIDPQGEEPAPRLTVLQRGKQVLIQFGTPDGFDTPQGTAIFAEMDKTNATPEVLFTSYSGGAHCCTQVYVATKGSKDRWHAVDFGDWDGDGIPFEDLNGDGVVEFAAPDQRFLYAFDCYACSAAPQRILTLARGKIEDVSNRPEFAKAQEAYLAQLKAWHESAEPGQEFSPGFFAGYIAQSALLGKGGQAWAEMMKAYDRKKDSGFEMCPGQPFPGECESEQMVSVGFPEALRSFLDATGYRF